MNIPTKNVKYSLLTSCILGLSLGLVACGGGNSSSAPNNTANDVVGEGENTPIDSVPNTPVNATIASSGVAVYGDIDSDKFKKVALSSGSSALLLDDQAEGASYAAAGLILPEIETLTTAPIQTGIISTKVSDTMQKKVDDYLKLIETKLESDGSVVTTLVNQVSVNSHSSVVNVTLDIDYGSSQQNANYVRNLVLTALNRGSLPKNVLQSTTQIGSKVRLNLSFWQDQGEVLLWLGAYLANQKESVSKKYNDLNNATALTASRATMTKNGKEEFSQTDGNAGGVDILWSIDASGSMGEEQSNLAAGAEQFFNTLNNAGIDYRLAVNTQGYNCKSLKATSTGEKYIDNSTTDALNEWKILSQPGTGDSGTETGFYCTREVDMTGFDRESAKNLVIFVSDEPENETVYQARPRSASSYSSRDFSDYKNYFVNSGATYFSITGDGTAVRETFEESRTNDGQCRGDGGNASGGGHFKEIARLTGGSSASICADSSDWSVMFEQILDTASGLASSFKLQNSPIPSTVKVLVDGKAVTRDISHQDGFDLVYGQNEVSLLFYGNSRPEKGKSIVVTYDYIGNRVRILE